MTLTMAPSHFSAKALEQILVSVINPTCVFPAKCLLFKKVSYICTRSSQNKSEKKGQLFFLTQYILALGLEKGEFSCVDIHFHEDICI